MHRRIASRSAFLAFALVLAAGCAKHAAPESGAATLPAVSVRIATIHEENVPVRTDVAGTVRPTQRAQIAARLTGAIEAMPLTLGQRVRAGDLLVKISASDTDARLAQARSQLSLSNRELTRERGLLANGASTADTVRGLEDRLALAQAMVREAEAMLAYATIRAPFDGVVARKPAFVGDLASPGLTLLELEGTTDFQVEAAIPDSLATGLTAGASLTLVKPAGGATFTGTLAELSSASDANARSVLARITVPAGTTVRSGEYIRVLLPGSPVRTLLIPAAAVSVLGQMERVFVVGEKNRAVLRLVKTGATHGDRVEILAGLDDGERVVATPPANLREGQLLDLQP